MRDRRADEEAFGAGGAMEAFLKAQKDGKIRYIGFSAHSDEAALAALKMTSTIQFVRTPMLRLAHQGSRSWK